MNTGSEPNPVTDISDAHALLVDLCRAFVPAEVVAESSVVHADALPAPADVLLVHHTHMTVELERHYGKPVEVHVLQEVREGDLYTRNIGLSLMGTDHLVECGIARVNFRHLSAKVRDEILAKLSPLGAILIKHNVHRRIKPRYFVQFPKSSGVIAALGGRDNPEPVFGRLGTIYCNNEPAIELLEIVINTEGKGHS